MSESEYQALRLRADAQGVTMSEHVRSTVAVVHESLDVAAELPALRCRPATAPSSANWRRRATSKSSRGSGRSLRSAEVLYENA